MASLLALLSTGSIGAIAIKLAVVLTVVSGLLTAVASGLTALGDRVPGWIGSLLSGIGSVVHFINGNFTAAGGGSQPPAPPAA